MLFPFALSSNFLYRPFGTYRTHYPPHQQRTFSNVCQPALVAKYLIMSRARVNQVPEQLTPSPIAQLLVVEFERPRYALVALPISVTGAVHSWTLSMEFRATLQTISLEDKVSILPSPPRHPNFVSAGDTPFRCVFALKFAVAPKTYFNHFLPRHIEQPKGVTVVQYI